MKSKDYIENIKGAERRFFTGPVKLEKRMEGEEESNFYRIEGYAALFDTRTDLGYVYEEIAPGAFDDVLNDDVRCLFNHDANLILARSANGSLTLEVDSVGLKYSYVTPNRSYAIDLQDAIQSGDVSASSFAFFAKEVQWIELKGAEKYVRRVTKVEQLLDVSPVTYPAYQDTTVAQRSLQDYVAAQNKRATEKIENIDVFEAQLIVNKFLGNE